MLKISKDASLVEIVYQNCSLQIGKLEISVLQHWPLISR